MWPSSTGSGYGYESCWAAIKFLMAILLSTSATPSSRAFCMACASSLASATVWMCSPFSSTVGFSLCSLANFSAGVSSLNAVGGGGGGGRAAKTS